MEKQKGSKRIEKVINYKKIFLEDFQAGSTRKSYEKSNLINSTFLSNKKVGEKEDTPNRTTTTVIVERFSLRIKFIFFSSQKRCFELFILVF